MDYSSSNLIFCQAVLSSSKYLFPSIAFNDFFFSSHFKIITQPLAWPYSRKNNDISAERVPLLPALSIHSESFLEAGSVVLTFESVNEILWCDHSNETSLQNFNMAPFFVQYFTK